jgi:hypothetical protein
VETRGVSLAQELRRKRPSTLRRSSSAVQLVKLPRFVIFFLLRYIYVCWWGSSYGQDVTSNEDRVSGEDKGVKPE